MNVNWIARASELAYDSRKLLGNDVRETLANLADALKEVADIDLTHSEPSQLAAAIDAAQYILKRRQPGEFGAENS